MLVLVTLLSATVLLPVTYTISVTTLFLFLLYSAFPDNYVTYLTHLVNKHLILLVINGTKDYKSISSTLDYDKKYLLTLE